MKHAIPALALLLAAGMAGHAAPARAGDLTNASLGCYVDTQAYDVPTPYSCEAGWTPYNGGGYTTYAHFEVSGLPAGNYTYTWTRAGSTYGGNCGGTTCGLYIAIGQSVTYSVLIRDTDTNATTTVSAQAYYYDAWN